MTYYFKYTCEACNGEGRIENPSHPLNDYKDPVCNECEGAGYCESSETMYEDIEEFLFEYKDLNPYDIRWSYRKELA